MKGFNALAALGLVGSATAASSFSPARPPAIPLAVKSPYMSTHLTVGSDGGEGGLLAADFPRFWQNAVSGWSGLIRVDGKTYCWMGNSSSIGYTAVNQKSFEYTATKSVFTMSTPEGVGMNITFMSPVYPNDYKRHSQTATYLHVDVWSNSGDSHDVSVYSDISAEWLSPDSSTMAQWDYGTSADDKVATHNVFRQEQLLFSEDIEGNGAIAQWGNWLWSTSNDDSMTYQSGADVDVRGAFGDNGKLGDTKDTNFRAIGDNWPVFGFSHDLGSVDGDGSATALFTIGLYQEQAMQFEGADGNVSVPAYWTNFWDDAESAAAEFFADFSQAQSAMAKTDARIQDDSVNAAGQDLATITTLAYRQAYGGIQIAGTEDKKYVFLKEISSDGNVGTVDVVYPAFPVYLYDNPDLVKLMLDPLYENQEAGWYPNSWAEHDIGASYPNATGHNDGLDERMSVEEPGNMLIMTLAYAQRTKDTDYLSQHYDIMKQWNQYLVNAALTPVGDDSLSTDDFAGAHDNQTDLALKGIIGIAAMGEIAKLTGNDDDAQNFSSIAKDYIGKWQQLGINANATPPHTTFDYEDMDSHGLLYNLYADKLLNLGLVPKSVYDMQSDFYQTVGGTYGVPLDTRWQWTKLDWECWCAAYSSKETQDYFHKRIVKWINETPTNAPLTDLYETEGGDFADETAPDGTQSTHIFAYRPVVGGVFALLALQ